MSIEHVKALVEKLQENENEIKLLQEDRRLLFDDYKEKLDIKAFKAAWTIAKKRSNVNEIEVDSILAAFKNID